MFPYSLYHNTYAFGGPLPDAKRKTSAIMDISLYRNPVNLGFSLTPLLISILSILQTRSLDQPLIMEMTNILNG
jgi:hypothetical protein